jgi:hypothetical protein
MKTNFFISIFFVILIPLFLLGGCSPKVTLTPMERAILNDYLMKIDRDTLAVKMFDHAYFSREVQGVVVVLVEGDVDATKEV